MPVLGTGGVLELRRELPSAVAVSPAAVRSHVNAIDVSEDGFWTGDAVWIWGPRGLPLDLNNDGRPDLRGGFGMFFGSSLGLYGARAARLQSGASKWFGPEPPFQTPADQPNLTGTQLFIFRDTLDRISFYTTLDAALDGDTEGRLAIYPVDFGLMLIAPAGSSGFQQRLAPAYPELAAYRFPEGDSERRLEQITTAALPEPTGDDDTRPWRFIAEMDEWELELSATEIDTSALGQRFGESTRAMVTGGGRINFFINRFETEREIDATFVARLLMVLDKGCKAEAIFSLTRPAPDQQYRPGYTRLPQTGSSYKAELMFTRNAVNTRADDVIRGTASFVTVGRIKLALS
jgi:hypothetical protein